MKYLLLNLFIITFVMINAYSQDDYEQHVIYTPHGTALEPNMAYDFVGTEWTSPEKDAIRAAYENYYCNGIVFVSEATRTYNCHAYAWYMTSPINGGVIWIDDPGDNLFWEDQSFLITTNFTEGAKVSYDMESGDHSAIATATPDIFISKWCDGPVFIHSKEDCPYEGYDDLTYFIACDPVEILNYTYSSDDEVSGCAINIQDEVIVTGANTDITFEAPYIEITGDFYVHKGPTIELKNP